MAIDRDIMRRRDVPMPSPGRQGQQMPSPDRRFDFRREMPPPAPMPSPDRRFDFRRDMPPPMPMPSPMPPPGMGPFRQMPFPDRMPRGQRMPDLMDMNPRQEGFQMFAMPAAATIDPSDYRTIIKMIEQGLDPEDYMNRGGIASLLK